MSTESNSTPGLTSAPVAFGPAVPPEGHEDKDSAGVLGALLTDEFAMRVLICSTPGHCRRRWLESPEVVRIRQALEAGELSEAAIRAFVDGLVVHFKPGVRFEHDEVIAVLAVVLEDRDTDFAREYLRDLAALNITEMSLSIRVARECLRLREMRGGREVLP